nr:MAG TPA: hypothetical protein [Caudoviricetes sp.]
MYRILCSLSTNSLSYLLYISNSTFFYFFQKNA